MPVDYGGIQVPYLRDEEIRRRADEFRTKYWGDKIPVDIEHIVERAFNILVIAVSDLRYQAHTEAYLSGDLKEIGYDPIAPDVRTRFSIAHEVGHLVLHADAIRKLRSRSLEEWKEMQKTLSDALWGGLSIRRENLRGEY